MSKAISTIEEIKRLFDQMAQRKISVGLTKQQAETVALRQIIKDTKAGEIEEAAARDFVIQIEMAKGSTREAADLAVVNIFGPTP